MVEDWLFGGDPGLSAGVEEELFGIEQRDWQQKQEDLEKKLKDAGISAD